MILKLNDSRYTVETCVLVPMSRGFWPMTSVGSRMNLLLRAVYSFYWCVEVS